MKHLFICITISLFILGCQQKKSSYELIIQLKDCADISEMYLFKEIDNSVDTVKLNKGIFTFSGFLDEPQICRVYSDKYPRIRKGFILDYGKTVISGEASKLSDSEISFENSMNNDLRLQFKKQLRDYQQNKFDPAMSELNNAYKNNNPEEIFQNLKKGDSLIIYFKDMVYQFVKSNANHSGTAQVISEELAYEMAAKAGVLKTKEYVKIYNLYSQKVRDSFYGIKLKKIIDLLNESPSKIGEQIIDFKMNNVNGNKISILDFKNKFVLIDFWSSGCKPCRQENYNLVQAYAKYNPKGFEIISISLDTNNEAWTAAVKKDKLNWTNLSDLNGFESEIAKHYKITMIPSNILIDKTGKIIETGIRGYELHRILDGIFNK